MPQPRSSSLTGPLGRLYAEPKPTPDESVFQVNNTSEQYYQSPYYLLHKSQVQAILIVWPLRSRASSQSVA